MRPACRWSIIVVTPNTGASRFLRCFHSLKAAMSTAVAKARSGRKEGLTYAVMQGRGKKRHVRVWKAADGNVIVR